MIYILKWHDRIRNAHENKCNNALSQATPQSMCFSALRLYTIKSTPRFPHLCESKAAYPTLFRQFVQRALYCTYKVRPIQYERAEFGLSVRVLTTNNTRSRRRWPTRQTVHSRRAKAASACRACRSSQADECRRTEEAHICLPPRFHIGWWVKRWRVLFKPMERHGFNHANSTTYTLLEPVGGVGDAVRMELLVDALGSNRGACMHRSWWQNVELLDMVSWWLAMLSCALDIIT